MNANLRFANKKDLPILLAFEQGIIDFERAFDPTLKEKDASYYDLAGMLEIEQVAILIVEVDEKIIASGYARIKAAEPYQKHQKYIYLGFMFVSPEFRGKGVNKLIMDGLFAWGKGKGIREFRLEVYAENAGALRAYEKVGFKKHMIEMRLDLED